MGYPELEVSTLGGRWRVVEVRGVEDASTCVHAFGASPSAVWCLVRLFSLSLLTFTPISDLLASCGLPLRSPNLLGILAGRPLSKRTSTWNLRSLNTHDPSPPTPLQHPHPRPRSTGRTNPTPFSFFRLPPNRRTMHRLRPYGNFDRWRGM